MTEKSYWWTTGGAGDGATTYTRVDLLHVAAVLGASSGFEGVVAAYENEMVGSVGGTNLYNIGTGGAIVDGKPYRNDATVGVTIPSTASLERIDRIVLRADWSAQTVRVTRIAGTESASPTPPAITQTSQTTYDIMLYQVRVNSSGTVTTEVDERVWATIEVDDDTVEIAPTGELRVKDDGIDDSKAGDRIAQIIKRQGGSSTNWGGSSFGTTNYTPTEVKVQAGCINWTGTAAPTATVDVTFPTAFTYAPIVLLTLGAGNLSGNVGKDVRVILTSNSFFRLEWWSASNQTQQTINWLAIGQ